MFMCSSFSSSFHNITKPITIPDNPAQTPTHSPLPQSGERKEHRACVSLAVEKISIPRFEGKKKKFSVPVANVIESGRKCEFFARLRKIV
jgi:hypothetical protein